MLTDVAAHYALQEGAMYIVQLAFVMIHAKTVNNS